MTVDKWGEYIALAGMAVLLINNMGRRRVRQAGKEAPRGWVRWLVWGDFVAFGLILGGLVFMWANK